MSQMALRDLSDSTRIIKLFFLPFADHMGRLLLFTVGAWLPDDGVGDVDEIALVQILAATQPGTTHAATIKSKRLFSEGG